jgi:hypothetical protein
VVERVEIAQEKDRKEKKEEKGEGRERKIETQRNDNKSEKRN